VLLDADPGITGVLCFSDRFAQGVLAGAVDRGLTVPGDLSIVGFDDSPVASNSRPALTTVRQDLAEKGHAAAECLIAAAKGRTAAKATSGKANSHKTTSAVESPETSGAVRHVIVPTELVVRASTAAPSTAPRLR
jgi:DNA-binding LacI/PurR family transcriptional regulator